VTALLVSAAVQSLAPAALIATVGLLVSRAPAVVDGGLDSPSGRALLWAVMAFAAILVVERLATTAAAVVRTSVAWEVDRALRNRAMEALERLPHLGALEDPGLQNRLSIVKGGYLGTPGAAATATVFVAGRYLQTLACAVIVAQFSVLIALYGLLVILAVRRRWHVAFGEMVTSMLANSGRLRRSTYFADLALLPDAAKEIRVFGLADWLIGRQRHFWGEAVEAGFDIRRRMRHRSNIEMVALLSSALLTTVLSARATVRGDIGLGLFVAITQARIVAAGLIGPTPEDYVTDVAVGALDALHAIEATAGPWRQRAWVTLDPRAPVHEIRFENVSFSYPGAAKPIIEDLDLVIEAGRSLAIVGANGAGKSTIVKLLCGLYEPRGGRIIADGVDIGEIDPVDWRRRLSVVFQDFTHYELSAADNVTLTRGAEAERDTAARLAGATAIIEALPAGWDTVLSRQYEGGVELSGGQWQRIALARGLYALQRGATVLVLDEPTANLDVRAEARLFEELLASTSGATTILVSHRFSSVRRAERIVVVEDGRITEDGDHDTLVAAGGSYAEMFRLQAERFADDVEARDA
jgi:ATP-binding cassette subfamily B protein